MGGRLSIVVVANTFAGTIADIDFNDVIDLYYIVLEENKPFEKQWIELKTTCMERFINPHIVFITPLIDHPKDVDKFLYSYGIMIQKTKGVKTYG